MSLIGKLLGRHDEDPYAEGIALYEEGHYAEAAERLRGAVQRHRAEGGRSLAAFYRRQALTGEGRRLLREGRAAAARPFLAEAVADWDQFPDLHCLLGVAQALSGAWDDALVSAANALRRNPDYVEARLLEAAALARAGRRREAAASLDKLAEAGRRVDHPLIEAYARPGGWHEDSLPGDLEDRIAAIASGPTHEADMAAAVALCRAGRWDDGVARLRALCGQRPDWPDYHLKLAAALYQTGRDDEALAAVDRALALHPRYRTAAHLKALVLADQDRFDEARLVVAAFPPATAAGGNPSEVLFSAYLAGVLSLLTGRCEEALAALAEWDDLTLPFPRGELLRAAAEDLLGRGASASQRLAALAAAWPGDADYQHLQACQLLRRGDLAGAERALGRWPVAEEGPADDRPLLLAAHLAVARGRTLTATERPACADAEQAMRFVSVRAAAQRGDWERAGEGARGLWDDGWRTERVALLVVAALAGDGRSPLPPNWAPPAVVPESAVPHLLGLLNRHGRAGEAREICRRHRVLHGEDPRWHWLWPPFWLEPVRRWIG